MSYNIPQQLSDDFQTATFCDGSKIIKLPKFLPCPRCGSNNIKCEKWLDKPGDMYPSYQCRCEKGHAWDDVYDDEEKAIAAWNERPICIYSHEKTKPWKRPTRDPYSSSLVPRG